MVKLFLILLGLCTLTASVVDKSRQIFIECGDGEEQYIQKLFFDVEDGFYADIGSYDPFYLSNTLNLYSKGWSGLTLDAKPERSTVFNYQRPDAINLNLALGQKDSIVTLYQFPDPSTATISQKVKDFHKKSINVISETKIAAITLGQLCDIYFLRKPLVMSFDIQGYAYEAFLNNNWDNPKCYPEILISQMNSLTKIANDKLPEQVLTAHGYKKIVQKFSNNDIYAHQSVVEKYLQRIKQGNLKFPKQRKIIGLGDLVMAFNNITHSQIHTRRYKYADDRLYIHAARRSQPLDLLKINKYSNQIAEGKEDRTIAVFNFNPHKSMIIVPSKNYTLQTIEYKGLQFKNITVFKENNKKFHTIILDHFYKPYTEPIIVVNQDIMTGKYGIGKYDESNIQYSKGCMEKVDKSLNSLIPTLTNVSSKIDEGIKNDADLKNNLKILETAQKQVISKLDQLAKRKQGKLQEINPSFTKQEPYEKQHILWKLQGEVTLLSKHTQNIIGSLHEMKISSKQDVTHILKAIDEKMDKLKSNNLLEQYSDKQNDGIKILLGLISILLLLLLGIAGLILYKIRKQYSLGNINDTDLQISSQNK